MTDAERAVTRQVLERKKRSRSGSLTSLKAQQTVKKLRSDHPLSNTIITAFLLGVPLVLAAKNGKLGAIFDENNVWILTVSISGLVLGQTLEAALLPLLLSCAFPPDSMGLTTARAASLPIIGGFWREISTTNHITHGLIPAMPIHLFLTLILRYVARTSITTTECTLIAGGLSGLVLNFGNQLYQIVLICGLLPFCATAVYLRRYITILLKRRPDNDKQLMNRLAANCYIAYLSSASVLFFYYLYRNGRFTEFFGLIREGAPALGWWVLCFSVALLIAVYMLQGTTTMLDSRRKLWHVTVVCMFWNSTGSQITPVALAVAIVLFLVSEAIRAAALPPFGKHLHEALRSFVDHRDTCGPLVISHIYLITGIAWPVFIAGGSVACSRAGLICLGLGDTLASQIGKRYGRLRLFGHKSLEGTIGFFLAALAGLKISQVPTQSAILVAFSTALLEATSIINDNLVLPSYMVAVLKLLKA